MDLAFYDDFILEQEDRLGNYLVIADDIASKGVDNNVRLSLLKQIIAIRSVPD